MALRFLADHCISNFIIQSLREAKHEVLRLKDLLPGALPLAKMGACRFNSRYRMRNPPEVMDQPTTVIVRTNNSSPRLTTLSAFP